MSKSMIGRSMLCAVLLVTIYSLTSESAKGEILLYTGQSGNGSRANLQNVGFLMNDKACYLTEVEVRMGRSPYYTTESWYGFQLFEDAGPDTDPRSGTPVCSFNEPSIAGGPTDYYSLGMSASVVLQPNTLYWLVMTQSENLPYAWNWGVGGLGSNYVSDTKISWMDSEGAWHDSDNPAGTIPSVRLTGSPVPSPSTLTMALCGLTSMLFYRRR